MPALSVNDFAELFGTDAISLPQESLDKIASSNWHYTVIAGQERDAILIDLLTRTDDRDFSIVDNEDNSRWIKGWGENLEALVKSDGDLSSLVPKYYKVGTPLRLRGQFIRAEDPAFEINFFHVYRAWLFENYLKDHSSIFELGSGSGFNLAELSRHYPEATIHGLDWAPPSVAIIETLRKTKGMNVHGHLFDFFHPAMNLDVPEGSIFYSFGALEQTGTSWQLLLDFLLAKKPTAVLHVEPIVEWYEPSTNLLDYAAVRAHTTRNYLKDYVTAIEKLEKQGRARILKTQRLTFGGTWHEGWSQLFWQPL